MLMMLLFFCVDFQAAVIQSAAACRAPRRSCCPRAGAWWETPRETPAATRAMRTWRMVMIALHSLDHHYPRPPPPSLGLAVVPQRLLRPFFPFCGPPTPPLLHLLPCFSNTSPMSLLWTSAPPSQNSHLIPPLVWVLQRITPYTFLTSAVLSLHFSSPLFPSCRRSVSSVPKSSCNWEGARSKTTKPSPPHKAGSTEGEIVPSAQNCSDESTLAAQSRTQIPSSYTCGCKADKRISEGWWSWAQTVFILSVFFWYRKTSLQSSMSVKCLFIFLFCCFFFFAVVIL